MLKINNSICNIISKTIKFGIYGNGAEYLPWYLRKDFGVKSLQGFPLIIIVKFENKTDNGYFQFYVEHIQENDFNKLVNKKFEGTFNLNDNLFQLFEITFNGKFLDSNDVKTNIIIKFNELKNNSIKIKIRIKSEEFDLFFDDTLDIIEDEHKNCTVYIPESHKKYDVLPICRKYNFEMIVWDYKLLNRVEILTNNTEYMGLCPYQRYKSYEELFNEIKAWINSYPNCEQEIKEYRYSLLKLNNKDLWAIVKYIGESNYNFTKDKYYYVVMYVEKNYWIIDGIIDNEEYNPVVHP